MRPAGDHRGCQRQAGEKTVQAGVPGALRVRVRGRPGTGRCGVNKLTAVSLFAGIGGIDRALELAGIQVTAAVEIDPDCRGVLRRHFPDTAIFNDVMEVTGDQLRAAGFVPGRGILAGGFPCQGLSVAGRRKGLADARSGLFWHVMRLADELRPRWLLLENVPGLLSSVCPCPGDGTCVAYRRAVACGEWRGDGDSREWFPDVPHNVSGGACPSGCMAAHGGAMGAVLGALGERGYGFAYRVLDAQFFGVPQRRRRVFIAGCLGDRARPVQVLLEPESGNGHPAPGRAEGPGVAQASGRGAGKPGVTGCLTPGMLGDYDDNTARGGFMVVSPSLTAGMGTNHGAPGHGGKDDAVLAVTAATLQGGGRRGHRVDVEGAAGGHLIAFDAAQITSPENRANPQPGDPAPPLASTGQPMVAGTLRSHPRPGSADLGAVTVAHALTAREGKGPDSDATSGFITVPVALRGRDAGGQIEAGEPGEPAFTVRTPAGGSAGEGVRAPGRRREDDSNLIAHALTSEGADASEDGTGRGTPLVAVPTSPTLTHSSAAHSGHHEPKVLTASAVRRLTPMECERLQGFPDRWTLHQADGSEQSDSARYRQLGNSVAVPCVAWITRRIVAVDASLAADRAAS